MFTPAGHIRAIQNININHSLKIKGNTVKIKVKSLMHTCSQLFEERLAIIPMKLGEAEIKVSIICEEFREPQIFSLPIKVIGK